MANQALENQVLLNRMFADTMDPFNRYFAQQLNLAANDLQRRRMLEDEARQILTASKVKADEHKFQMDREGAVWKRYMDVEKERTKRAEEVEETRLKRYETLVKERDADQLKREQTKQTQLDIEREGWDESYRQLNKKRDDIITKRDKLRTVSQEDRNKVARSVASKYVSPSVLDNFFPENAKGDLAPLLTKYITKEKDQRNAVEDFQIGVMSLTALRQPEIESYEKELNSIDSRLRTIDPKISPAAFSPRPFPPLPQGFPGAPGAAVVAPPDGPAAGMTQEERERGFLASIGGGGGGMVGPPAPSSPAPASPPMTGLIPRAARVVAGAIPGAWDVTKQLGGEVVAPAFAAAGGAYDVLMSGRPPLSPEAYGGAPLPSQPYLPRPSLGITGALLPMFGAGAQPQAPNLGALGVDKTDLEGMRSMFLGDRLRQGATPQQAVLDLQSMFSKLQAGDGEARKVLQEYHQRWLQKKAMQGVVPQAIPTTTTNSYQPQWGAGDAANTFPAVMPRTTTEAMDRYRMRRGLPGVSTNAMPQPAWGTGWR